MWSRAVFEIRPDLCILRRFSSIHGSPKPEYQTPILPNGCSQYGHEKWPPAGVTGHLWKIHPLQWTLSPFKLLFCDMKHVSASLEELHQSAADRVDNNDRNVETCQCHATRQHASVHPHSFSPSVAVSKSMLSLSPSYCTWSEKTHFFFEFKSNWFSLDQVI